MHDVMNTKMGEYKDDLKDVFIFGDFNLPENSSMFHVLQKSIIRV